MAKSDRIGIFLLVAILSLGVFSGVHGGAGGSLNVSTQTVVTNAVPIVSSVVLNNGNPISLTPGGTTTVTVSFQVTDYNGCGDVFTGGGVTSTIYAGFIGANCTRNAGNCYITSTVAHNCSGQNVTANATATASLYYFAGATDASSTASSSNWVAQIVARDAMNATGTATSTGVELNTLLAIDTVSSTVDYGTVTAGTNTGSTNSIVTIQNAGNSSSTLEVSGTSLSSGGSSIPASSQHYGTSTFTFGGLEGVLSGVQTAVSGFLLGPATRWQSSLALPVNSFNHSSAGYNERIYVTGGYNVSGSNPTSTVLYSRVLGNGNLQSWQTGSAMPAGLAFHSSVAANGFLYSMGGLNATGTASATSSVFFAPINSDGTLGSWSATAALPSPIGAHAGVAHNGYAYVLGGLNSSGTPTSTVLFAPMNSSGTLGSWTATTPLPSVMYSHSVAAHDGFLYVTGGATATTSLTTVYYAQINATGSISSWTAGPPLAADFHRHASFVDGGPSRAVLRVVGGYNLVFFPTNIVSYSPIHADGSLGEWWSIGAALPQTQFYHSIAQWGGYVFSLGGFVDNAASSTVYSTPLATRNTYWGFEVPAGTATGTYTGTVTAVAIFSP